MTNRLRIARLTLQIERGLLNQQNLKTLLANARAVIAERRRELRGLKARRTSPHAGRTK